MLNIRRSVVAFLVVGLMATLGPAAWAQEGARQGGQGGQRGGGMQPDAQLNRLSEALTLTDDQKAKIKPILEAQYKERTAISENQSLSQEDRGAKMRELNTSTQAKVKAVLTPEQQKKYAELQPQGGRGGQRQGAGGGEKKPN